MRNFIAFGIIAIMLASCSSSKKVVSRNINTGETKIVKVKIEKDECQKKSEDNSEFLRGYGIGTSADRMTARDIASLSARNEIVNSVQVCARNFADKYNQQHNSSSSGEMARVDAGKFEQSVGSIAEETLRGARIICSSDYQVGNQYETHVCVELTNVDFTNKVYNKLTSDEKLRIDFDAEQFRKRFEEELEEYRKRKAQGL
ncbi:MAG: hypothetical protein COC06_08125 [Bacteroidales bacterium]|nr:MAG: hypothetical protein COC06_08125 [Bacteroidales bacterium]